MIIKIPASDRHLAFHGWLKTFHLFSFGEYYDPKNINFGNLRVFNDDWIAGESGFAAHPHNDMEIVTIVLSGELTHQDSLGNKGVIRAGEVQRMSAGSGVIHSEHNYGKEPVSLFQIWIFPHSMGITPSYEQKDFSAIKKKNVLVPVASGAFEEGVLHIQADAAVYTCELEEGNLVNFTPGNGFGVFIYVSEGALEINGERFERFDQARIAEEKELEIKAVSLGKFVLIWTRM